MLSSGDALTCGGAPARHEPVETLSELMTSSHPEEHVRNDATGHPENDAAAEAARLVRRTWAEVEPRSEEMTKYFYSVLFSLAPETRELFPADMEVQRGRLLRALVHVVQTIDRPDELRPFLEQLGRDHRKFGVVTSHYENFGTALLATVRKFAGESWTDEVERAWAHAYTFIAGAMAEAAEADPGPAWYPGEVVHRERIGLDRALIRVRLEHPLPYRAGQYVSVEVPQRPKMWRYLSPANAPDESGELQFLVRAVPGGWVSRSLVGHAEAGDEWRIGPPMGRMSVDRESGRDVLMVAGGTGVAPMRALIEELAAEGPDEDGNTPAVHLFYGGREPDDLHDLERLQQFALEHPWLTVTPVLETDNEEVGALEGQLPETVSEHGPWDEREVLVAGSPEMLRATVSRLTADGVPAERIHYDPFAD